jgi:hypothetical protein
MKKFFSLALVLCAFAVANAQYTDDFESYADFTINPAGAWTFYDLDESETYGMSGITWENAYQPMAFMVFNPSQADQDLSENYPAHSGDKYLVAWAATTPPNNDWIVSTQLNGNAGTFSFYARALTDSYGPESFVVYASTTDNQPASFTKLSSGNEVEVDAEWTQFSYDYPAGTKFVAINVVSSDVFGFCLDDVTVSTGTGIEDNEAETFAVYPNPATNVLNVTGEGIAEISNMLGQIVMTENVQGNAQINVAGLESGMYFVSMNGTTKKFMKK